MEFAVFGFGFNGTVGILASLRYRLRFPGYERGTNSFPFLRIRIKGATIYTKLGIPLDTIHVTPDGRPIQLCDGRVIDELMG